MHCRFYRWHGKGIWAKNLETLVEAKDFEELMIDASHVKVHPDTVDARSGNQEVGLTIVLSKNNGL